jgi:hypothetical protein
MSRLENARPKTVFRPYFGYVLNFVGAGMVSGGVVHYPLNEDFYGSLTIAGAFVFTAGAIVTEIVNGRKLGNALRVFFLISTSLMLSFGIGMLSGGIQHFTDFPDRATFLIPFGLVLSFLAFCLKNETFRRGLLRKTLIGGTGVVVVAGASFFALSSLAATLEPSGHSHGEETSESHSTTDESVEAPAAEQESTGGTTSSDGHDHGENGHD